MYNNQFMKVSAYFIVLLTRKCSDSFKHEMYKSMQGVSQDLKIWCPNLLEISKQGVQIVHLQYFYM